MKTTELSPALQEVVDKVRAELYFDSILAVLNSADILALQAEVKRLRAALEMDTMRVQALLVGEEIADLQIQVARLRAENARLREALEAVEWSGPPHTWIYERDEWCLWCKNYRPDGHRADCQRQIALGVAP